MPSNTRQAMLFGVLIVAVLVTLAFRMAQSYDHWQGDESTYGAFASRVAAGNIPYVDWSPGFSLAYSPWFAVGLEGANAQLAMRIATSSALLLIFGVTIFRFTRDRWLTLLLTLAFAAHPMFSVGMTLRVFTALVIALVLLATTFERKGTGFALLLIALGTLVRPEFWIWYALTLVVLVVWPLRLLLRKHFKRR